MLVLQLMSRCAALMKVFAGVKPRCSGQPGRGSVPQARGQVGSTGPLREYVFLAFGPLPACSVKDSHLQPDGPPDDAQEGQAEALQV